MSDMNVCIQRHRKIYCIDEKTYEIRTFIEQFEPMSACPEDVVRDLVATLVAKKNKQIEHAKE